MSSKQDIDSKVGRIKLSLTEIIAGGSGQAIIQAPPGSGKTRILSDVAIAAVKQGCRVAVATQTNSQADELCNRIVGLSPATRVIRYLSSNGVRNPDLLGSVSTQSDISADQSKCIVVGTSAKWSFATSFVPFDVLFIEEAWQLAYADFLLLDSRIAPMQIMIGDPGQIAPVVTVPVNRWSTSLNGPHRSAPSVVAHEVTANNLFALPATRRLPHDTAKLIQGFYSFEFSSYAEKGEKRLVPRRLNKNSVISRALFGFEAGTVLGLTVQTPKEGVPRSLDDAKVQAAVKTVKELLDSQAEAFSGDERSVIGPQDIGVVATHRAMVNAVSMELPEPLRSRIMVDTPERWQGLERKAMIAIHPLSGTLNPSGFDLETGRLCVMASRHTNGLIILSRDHISETLDECFPPADHAFNSVDTNGRGHFLNEQFWNELIRKELLASIDKDIA